MNLTSSSSREPKPTVRPRSMLVHVGVLLGLAAALAFLVAAALWFGLGSPPLGAPADVANGLTTANRLDVIKIVLAVIAGVGGIVALTVTYRRQRYGEAADDRERVRAFTDRFGKAVEQMGHDRASVRAAGIYAMAALADGWEEGRQMCIDVLCAYLRIPYETGAQGADEREVRRTLLRVIRNHLRPQERWGPVKWSSYRFSFEGAVLERGDLSGVWLAPGGHMTFHGAQFVGGFLFTGMRTNGCPLWFTKATLAGEYVRFDDADFLWQQG